VSLPEPSAAPSHSPLPLAWDHELARGARLAVAVAIGALASVLVWLSYHGHADAVSDWDQCWLAARALLQGSSAYGAVNADTSPWPLIYPLPAVLVSLPFAPLPLGVGRALFAGVTSGLLAYAVSTRWVGLLPFISGAYAWALFAVQWVPLLVAAVLLPWLSFLLVVKPTTGVALGIGWPSRRAVIGAVVLCAVSFMVEPGWLLQWREGIGAKIVYHVPPVMRPFGWLLLLALLRWRQPGGRFLLASAFIPQAAMPSDLLALLLIPRTFRERVFFVGSTQLLALYALSSVHTRSPGGFAQQLWPATLLLGYLPALVMVLRRSNIAPPNQASTTG
jgi:hypothetical protein